MKSRRSPRVLLTTPDYPPRIGGLSTFTLSIERALKKLDIEYELFHWSELSELSSNKGRRIQNAPFDFGVHIHFYGSHYLKGSCHNHINFLHGSELLFTSPNLFKKIFKKVTKPFFMKSLEESLYNIAISEFTLKKIQSQGLNIDYGRDLVFHNCISMDNHQKSQKKTIHDEVLKFICVARDVPHKNIRSCFELCKVAGESLKKRVILYAPDALKRFTKHPLVEVIDITGLNNEERDSLYRECHFNLLLSLDHAHKGFYEGFGLSVLEAAKQGTPSIVSPYGGLPEACHHKKTGWVLPLERSIWQRFFIKLNQSEYQQIGMQAYHHTISSHSEDHYQRLLALFLFQGKGGRMQGVGQ